MRNRRNANPVPTRLALALSVLLAAASLPALAAERSCQDAGGTDIAGPTNEGVEDSEGATGENSTCDAQASAYGFHKLASAQNSGSYSSAFGAFNTAIGGNASAFGYSNTAFSDSSAFGSEKYSYGVESAAFGYHNTASGPNSTAMGYENTASGAFSSAFGNGAQALNAGSTAIGYQAIADRNFVIAVGKSGGEHQIIHMTDGTEDFDAVNVRQLRTLATWMGSGASFTGGVFNAPTFTIQGMNYGNVAAAKANAAAGDAATLTASKTYTDTTATQTLTSSKSYTDSKFAAWNDSFSQYKQQVDVRFAQTDKRISQIGAMGTAMTQVAVNAANGSGPNGRIAIGVGAQGSQGAVSVGYGKRIGDRASFSLGASFSSGESSVGGGFGFDL
ncbi:YadA-like family protein [Thermomonas sp.]|uniref:YadA-like family protein n=1 Tax=Thermomonas sp. TaxID=1971895 RepID=UPI00248A34EB|nr:YadA-like family protein [Thermomonas sp.]MDI1252317.1 YadA-like family protein [Thermomonas sp.]